MTDALIVRRGGGKPEGQYVWNKYTVVSSAKGEFITCVADDNETKYPDNGVQGGYYYEKVFSNGDAVDDNLLPANIKEGVPIFDVLGTLVPFESDDFTQFTHGTYTGTSQYGVSVEHGLGRMPSLFILYDGTGTNAMNQAMRKNGSMCSRSGATGYFTDGAGTLTITFSDSTVSISPSQKVFDYQGYDGYAYAPTYFKWMAFV